MAGPSRYLCFEGDCVSTKNGQFGSFWEMHKNNLNGLSPLWLMSLAMVLGVFVTVAVPAIISVETVRAADWISFAGSVLVSVVTAIAIGFAWRGIVLQSRITLMSREESRIETELPGLVEAVAKIGRILAEVSLAHRPEGVVQFLRGNGIGNGDPDLIDEVQKLLPQTDARTRRTATELFFYYNMNAGIASRAQKAMEEASWSRIDLLSIDPRFHAEVRATAEGTREEFEKRYAEMMASYEAIAKFRNDLSDQIAEMRDLAPKYRAEIRAYIKI
jgi:hypothetical protein